VREHAVSCRWFDMDFTVEDAGGTTEYIVVEGLANDTSDTRTRTRTRTSSRTAA